MILSRVPLQRRFALGWTPGHNIFKACWKDLSRESRNTIASSHPIFDIESGGLSAISFSSIYEFWNIMSDCHQISHNSNLHKFLDDVLVKNMYKKICSSPNRTCFVITKKRPLSEWHSPLSIQKQPSFQKDLNHRRQWRPHRRHPHTRTQTEQCVRKTEAPNIPQNHPKAPCVR